MGVGKRIAAYLIAASVIMFVFCCIAIYRHRDYLSQYFSASFSAYGSIFLYILIFGVGIAFLLRSILR